MPKMTKHDALVAALEAEGSLRVTGGRSTKYTQMTHSDGTSFYYIGKSGALRFGKNTLDSISMTDGPRYVTLLKKGGWTK